MASVQPRSFGELLRRYRIAAGLTQEELAERAGLSARAIGALETGDRRAPRKDTVALLATALGLAPAEHALFASAARAPAAPSRNQADVGGIVGAQSRAATSWLIPWQGQPSLVGRREELSAIERFLAAEGPRLFLLAGEPGIGKSRLVEEVGTRARETGWTILFGGCHRRSGQEPFAPFVGALIRFLASRSSAQQRLDLQGCGWLVRLLPELAEHAVVPAASWTLPPEQERRLMFGAVARFLANIAGPEGTLLVLDDLHWAGGDALDLLGTLARDSGASRLRIVGAYRDTDVAPHDPLPMLLGDLSREGFVEYAAMSPLRRADATALLDALLSIEPGRQQAHEQILLDVLLERAGGLPFFLVSCAQELRAGKMSAATAASAVPWSAAESVRARVTVLPAVARSAIGAAAVAGRQIPRKVLVAAAGTTRPQTEAEILTGLEAACRARLLAETDDGAYVFTHDLIRETILADLTGARRAMLHRGVAAAMEALPDAPRRAAELAWHFTEGDEPARALPYALLAGDEAEAVYAHDDAERHYSQAVELARLTHGEEDEAEALVRRADARFLQTRYADAHADLLRASELFGSLGNWERLTWATCERVKCCDALGTAASTLPIVEGLLAVLAETTASTSPREATRHAESLQTRAELAASSLSDRSAARLFLCLTTRMVHLDRYDEASGLSEATVRRARGPGNKRIESLAYSFRAIARQAVGDLDGAGAALAAARETADGGADLEARFMALLWDGALHDVRADPRAAHALWSEALDTLTRLGDSGRLSGQLLLLGYSAFVLGDWREARLRYEESHTLAVRRGGTAGNVAQRAILHLDLLEGKQAEGAAGALTELRTPSRLHDPAAALFVLSGLADVALLSGEAGAVRDRISAVIASWGANYPGAALLYVLLASAELQLTHDEAAREALDRARQLTESRQRRVTPVDLLRIEALFALRHGRREETRQALEEALALARAMPYPYAEAKALSAYGQFHEAQGQRALARERYEQALAICCRLGERLYAERIERTLAGLASQP